MDNYKSLLAMKYSLVLASLFALAQILSFYLPPVYEQVNVIDSGTPRVIEIIEVGIIETFRQNVLPWLSLFIALLSVIICLACGFKFDRNRKQQGMLLFSLFIVVFSWISIPRMIT